MKKILLIEDDQYISRMYHRILTLEGYEVKLAEDGEEGVMKAQSFKPELILLDMMMPKMNGIQVLEALKANPLTQAIPVIVLTNLVGDEEKEAILAKGAVKYLTKSDHEPREVVEIIKQFIETPPPSDKTAA